MERCPCCNAQLSGATVCSRCGCDLEIAARAERDAEKWLEKAVCLWLKDDARASLNALDRSLRLNRSELAQSLRAHIADRLASEQ